MSAPANNDPLSDTFMGVYNNRLEYLGFVYTLDSLDPRPLWLAGRPPDDAPTEKIGYYLTEAEALITGPEMEKNANRTELSL
jgi:hypothetical protein